MQILFFKYLGIIIRVSLLYFSFFLPCAHADTAKKVLILPIQLHAEKDLAYLKQGIRDMLISRLNQENRLEIISAETINKDATEEILQLSPKKAIALGQKFNADYVIYGSVTLIGESISTDTRMAAIASGRTVVQFNRAGQSRSELIHHIDAFADQIQAEVFDRPLPAPDTAATPSKQKEEIHQHPEKLLAQRPQRHISQKFKMEIRALALGDVTGDKRAEIIFIDQNNIHIYRPGEKELQVLQTIEEKSYNNFISVDVADINGNGKAEIFITNLPRNGDRLQSFVLEYNNNAFVRIAEKQRFYFRTIFKSDGSLNIVAQKRGAVRFTSETDPLFDGRVFDLVWKKDRYTAGDNVSLPKQSHIYNFAKADLFSSGKEQTARYTNSNVLKINVDSANVKWSSEDSFGSTATFLEVPDSQDRDRMKRYYLPTRIVPMDFNGDGNTDLLVIKNEESLSSFRQIKQFKNGSLICLSWDGLNFLPLWQSKTVSKYISDFAVADLMGNGRREMVYAVVAKRKGMLQSGQSYVVRQTIPAVQ